MEKIIVTSGQLFTDIDALACAIAYVELLKKEGKNAEAILPGILNKSVTKKIKEWNLNFSTETNAFKSKCVLIDISDPKYFAGFVKEKNIIEIFDHHPGFVNYWEEKLGTKSRIESIGSCATLIWEEYKKRNFNQNISEVCANLLYTAIVSNTLYLKAKITNLRDKRAFKEIYKYTKLPNNWIEIYFKDQDKETDKNIEAAIKNDIKNIKPIIGQLEFWDSKKIIFKHLYEIEKVMRDYHPTDWFLTSPSISEGKNYLFTKNPELKTILEKTIKAKFDGDIGTTDKLWLRKEIFKKIQETSRGTWS